MGRAMNRADILNVIREDGRDKDTSADCECETLHRLYERYV